MKSKKKLWVIIVSLSLFLVLTLALLGGLAWIRSLIELIDNDTSDDAKEDYATAPIETIDIGATEEDNYFQQIEQNNKDDKPGLEDSDKVINILLLGSDARGAEAGLSDSMILLTINKETKRIVLCSFMRDLLVKMPENPSNPVAGQLDKLTHAHAYGGPELTMACLRENFGINVQYYAKVKLSSFISVVDAVGGVELQLTVDEVNWINDGVTGGESANLFPYYDKTTLEVKDGVQKLNGLQALYHARNRAIGNDFARTERQRNIIMQVLQQMKGLSLTQLDSTLRTIMPLIVTNMDNDTIMDLTLGALTYVTYEKVSTRFPLDGTFHEVEYNIIPDIEANYSDLFEKIYGYKPEKKED